MTLYMVKYSALSVTPPERTKTSRSRWNNPTANSGKKLHLFGARSLHQNFGTGAVVAAGETEKPLLGNAFSGIKGVFTSPYLLGIAGFIALMTFASTILYFAQSDLVYSAMTDRGERTAFLAKIDLTVNILTIVFEVYLTARLIRWL